MYKREGKKLSSRFLFIFELKKATDMQLKNIIFDLGGVILNIDYSKTIEAFKAMGINNFDELYTQASQTLLFDRIEKGAIANNVFLVELQQILPSGTSLKAIEDAWNAMLLDLPQERLELLNALKKKYNTVILSNTNQIHVSAFHKIIKMENKIDSLDPFFDSVYFSCELNLRKPEPEIFKYVCEKQGFLPEETLFIDDSAQHIEGARTIGLHAYLLEKEDLVDLFDTHLNFIPHVPDTTR